MQGRLFHLAFKSLFISFAIVSANSIGISGCNPLQRLNDIVPKFHDEEGREQTFDEFFFGQRNKLEFEVTSNDALKNKLTIYRHRIYQCSDI
jgi:hypothetical protein